MSLFDSLMGKTGSIDLGALAQQIGLDPDELKAGGESLLAKLASGDHDATSATVATSAETGIDASKLEALLPALSSALGQTGAGDGEGMFAGIAGKLGGALGGGSLSEEIGGFANKLFGRD
jgi:hypothetical protein